MPDYQHFIIVCDAKLARIILDGNDEKHSAIEPGDKTFHYRNFNVITFGLSTMFSKKTAEKSWYTARKAMAPSFSYSNIYKSLPKLSDTLNELKAVMNTFAESGEHVDISSLMVNFTFDFMTTSMFGENYHAIEQKGEGDRFMKELNITLKEYTLKQAFNPFRKYMIWNKDVIRAKDALAYVQSFTRMMLAKYR
jgi:cytochrome P450